MGHSSALSESGSDRLMPDCCEEPDSVIATATYSLLTLLLLLPLFWFIPLLKSLTLGSAYWRQPPPRYNYPAHHIIHCSLLN